MFDFFVLFFTIISWYYIFLPDFKASSLDTKLKSKCYILTIHLFIVWFAFYLPYSLSNQIVLLTLLFCSLSDVYDQSIYPVVLIPAILIGLLDYRAVSIDYCIGLVTFIALLICIYFEKMGLGDALIYLMIGLNFSFENANYILITACFILLSCQLTHSKVKHPFVPYLLVSFLLVRLLIP